MNKKAYQQPTMTVVKLHHRSMICQSVTTVSSDDVDLDYGGGAATEANSRRYNVWNDDWSE